MHTVQLSSNPSRLLVILFNVFYSSQLLKEQGKNKTIHI